MSNQTSLKRFLLALTLLLAGAGAAAASVLLGISEEYDVPNNINKQKLVVVDRATGAASAVGPLSNLVSGVGMAYDDKRDVIYVSDVDAGENDWGNLATLDPLTGTLTVIGSHVTSVNIMGLAYVSANDTLYGADLDSGNLVRVDRATGAITPVGSFGVGTPIEGRIRELAYDALTNTMWGSSGTALYTIDRGTGAATLVGAHDAAVFYHGNPVDALAFDPVTRQLYASEWGQGPTGDRNARLFTVSTSTGATTIVGSSGVGMLGGLVFVPELLFADGFEDGTDLPGSWDAAQN